MDDVTGSIRRLRSLLEEFRPALPDVAVALVISERLATELRANYDGFSVAASFLNASEIGAIVDALRGYGMFVRHFNDEIDFMRWATSGGIASMPRAQAIVYTSAVNGIGPGRRALVPAFCSLSQIPTVNSDAYSCAINRHKYHWNTLLRSFDLPAPRCWSIDPVLGWHLDRIPDAGKIVIGKATYEGSSIGLTTDLSGPFGPDIERRFREVGGKLRQPLTVQEFVAGDEYEVPVIETPDGLFAPAPVAILNPDRSPLGDGILAYDQVFDDGYQFEVCPSAPSQVVPVAKDVVRTLGFRGFSRIDFRVGADGKPMVIDVSSTPHLTRTTSFKTLFEWMGFNYEDMWALCVGLGARRAGLI